MRIRLKTRMAGPDGNFDAGSILTTDPGAVNETTHLITKDTAITLLNGEWAEKIDAKVEKAVAPEPETAAPVKKGKGK